MIGKSHIHTQQNGKMYRKHSLRMLIAAFFTVVVLLGGCSSGRGDWRYELINGYALDRGNAHCIRLVHRENPSEYAARIVIDNFYITFYYINKSYIGLKGIPTADSYATDEELCSTEVNFYIVSAEDGEIYGPYSSYEEYEAQCEFLECGQMGEWMSTAELDRILP